MVITGFQLLRKFAEEQVKRGKTGFPQLTARLHRGLNSEEAMCLGYRQNYNDNAGKSMTDYDQVIYMRRVRDGHPTANADEIRNIIHKGLNILVSRTCYNSCVCVCL